MSAICGIWRREAFISDVDFEAVRRMLEALRHRGPGAQAVWSGKQVILGSSNLSVTDPGGEPQFVHDDTEELAVVLDGELYNKYELRKQLLQYGYDFIGWSSAEVILRGYMQWGDGVANRLQGSFAFVLWDGTKRTLKMVRDAFGEKPLYYSVMPEGAILVASEIKALVTYPHFVAAPNVERLPEYMAYRSIAGTGTLFKDINRLPPGTITSVTLEKIVANVTDGPGTPNWRAASRENVVATGSRLLFDAVAVRLTSRERIGTITSGGLDSSLVTAITAQVVGQPVDTFCVGFEDSQYDERPFARILSERVGARLHEIEISAEEFASNFAPLTRVHDEPLTHPNAIPMFLLFKYARQEHNVELMVSGEGADELFGGYSWYGSFKLRRMLKAASPLMEILPPIGRLATLKRVLARDYPLWANAFSTCTEVESLGVRGGDPLTIRRKLWNREIEEIDAALLYDQATYLPPLIQRQDRMSVAAGVEARVVFLDSALATWVNGLPGSVRFAGALPKPLLKDIAAQWVPAEIINRRKVGFTLPLGQWLRSAPQFRRSLDSIRDEGSFVGSHLDRQAVHRVVSAFIAGAAGLSDLLWTLIALETWAGEYFGQDFNSKLPPSRRSIRIG